MGRFTGISWCDSTFNPWIGCTKVSEGCKFCYAETQNNLYKWAEGWGKGSARKRTSIKNWGKPIEWAKAVSKDDTMHTHRVFCASLADVFDDEVPQSWRDDLWSLIDTTNAVSNGKMEWLLLTKRIENAKEMLPERWLADPFSVPHVRLGISAENDMRFRQRLPVLFDTWGSGKNFISAEPLLGPIYLDEVSEILVDWIICGGESGKGCRPMSIQWAIDLKDACYQMNIPFFMKQLGGYPDKRDILDDWPDELQIQEFPK